MPDWRTDRVGAAHRGENPMVMARMRSGFAVMGDTQYLPGYSVLLCADASADHLTDLAWEARSAFLLDLSLLGEAVQAACGGGGLRRVNYAVLGNADQFLHGHVHPRYDWEPAARLRGPVWGYGATALAAPEHAYDDQRHRALRSAITRELDGIMQRAYR